MKRNHSVLILGSAVAGRVAEAKLSERLGLHQNPYYLDSIKDRHTNDDWRGKGNRRKLFK